MDNIEKFVICIDNEGYEASLEKWKVYPSISCNEIDGYVRIVDESGESYLYPEKIFREINVPLEIEENYLLEV